MSSWHPKGIQLFNGKFPAKGKQTIAQSLTEFINTYSWNLTTPVEEYCADVTLKPEMAVPHCHILAK